MMCPVDPSFLFEGGEARLGSFAAILKSVRSLSTKKVHVSQPDLHV